MIRSLSIPMDTVSPKLSMGTLPKRVAFSRDLGVVPMASEVADVCRQACSQFARLGTEVTDEAPIFLVR